MLYKNNYIIQEALIRLETYKPFVSKWTSEEIEIFNVNVSKEKNFYEIKKLLPNKTVKQIVDYYYRVKKTRCITIPKDFNCPYLSRFIIKHIFKLFNYRICLEKEFLERKACQNCIQNLWKNTEWKKNIYENLCPPCLLYFK